MSEPISNIRRAFEDTPYGIVELLGKGAMGEVWAGVDSRDGEEVVLKVLLARADNDWARDRFRLEAKALMRLSHPNLLRVSDYGQTSDGRPYYVAERLYGDSLGEMLREERWPAVAEAIRFGIETLRALAVAHDAGLVHRDIKPDNLFVCQDGSLRVLDFGITRVLDGAAADTFAPAVATNVGAVMGTALYMAPEQAMGRAVDTRADLYALGVVLYRLLTRRRPFSGSSALEVLAANLNHHPPPPSEVVSWRLPASLDRVVMRALEKDRERRFQHADEMADALEKALAQLHAQEAEVAAAAPEPVRAKKSKLQSELQNTPPLDRGEDEVATAQRHAALKEETPQTTHPVVFLVVYLLVTCATCACVLMFWYAI